LYIFFYTRRRRNKCFRIILYSLSLGQIYTEQIIKNICKYVKHTLSSDQYCKLSSSSVLYEIYSFPEVIVQLSNYVPHDVKTKFRIHNSSFCLMCGSMSQIFFHEIQSEYLHLFMNKAMKCTDDLIVFLISCR
jgi:hypothetical protein